MADERRKITEKENGKREDDTWEEEKGKERVKRNRERGMN